MAKVELVNGPVWTQHHTAEREGLDSRDGPDVNGLAHSSRLATVELHLLQLRKLREYVFGDLKKSAALSIERLQRPFLHHQ